MPQLDFATFPSQLFWLGVSFAVLYVLMSRFALPRVGAALEARHKTIEADKQAALDLKERAEAALAAYEEAMVRARAQAHAHREEIRQKVEEEISEQLHEAEKVLGELTRQAEVRVKDIYVAGLRAAQDGAAEAARALIERLAAVKPDSKAFLREVR